MAPCSVETDVIDKKLAYVTGVVLQICELSFLAVRNTLSVDTRNDEHKMVATNCERESTSCKRVR